MSLLAVKHLDPVVGVDVHSVLVTPGTPPVFLPHPHVGFMLDLREYIQAAKAVVGCIAMMIVQEKVTEYIEDHPEDVTKLEHLGDEASQQVNELIGGGKLPDLKDDPTVAEGMKLAKAANRIKNRISDDLGSNVGSGGGSGRPIFVNGMMRATAGTHAYHVPGLHFPLGESFAPPPAEFEPSNDGESFMGSKTVLANNDPLSYMALEALSCWSIGMEPPPHNSAHTDRTYPSMPSSVMLPIPAGRPVLVGGPPIMNMAAAAKGLFKAFRGSKWAKALADKLHLKPGFLKCNVLHAEPVDVTTGEVIVAQHDFTITGHLPLEWNRCYASRAHRLGTFGVGWSTPADIHLNLISRDDGIGAAIYFVDHATAFDEVPTHAGWATRVTDWQYGYALYLRDNQLVLRTGEGIEYGFLLRHPWDTIVNRLSGEASLTLMLDWIGDLYGHAWLFERGSSGHVSRIVEHGVEGPTGRLIECRSNVDVDGHCDPTAVMTLTNADGHVYPLVRYERDRDRNLVAAFDAMGYPRRFDYESGNRMTRHVSAGGVSFHYGYRRSVDGEWRIDHAWGDDGVLDYRFEYDLARNQTRLTESMGRVAVIQMNERHVPIAEIDVLGGMTSYRYDSQWRTCAQTDPMGRTSRWEYDANGNLIAQIMPDGRSVRAEYDSNHKPVCVTGAGGRQFRYEWDARGRLVSRATPSRATFRYAYDTFGRVTSCAGPQGDVTTFGYDRHGNLTTIVDALGHRTQYERDARGYVISSLDAAGHQNRYERDACGRLVRAIEWDGRETHCSYDPDGNLLRYRDPVGNVTRLAYTALGEIAKRIQSDGTEVQYRYDTEGQLVQVVNERGESYLLKRDALGRIVEEIDYWGQSRLYEYGSTAELLRSVDPHGRAIEYRYDEVGRIVEKRIPDPDRQDGVRTDCFHYDEHGDLIRASTTSSLLEFRYDDDGRLVEERQGDDFTLSNRYDAAGNRIERRTRLVAGSEIVEQSIRYNYDALNAVVGIEIDGHAPIVIERDALGQIRDERLGDALRREMSYEANGRLSRQALLADTGEMFAIEYAYDANGDLIERRDSRTGIEQFQYDPVGQVVAHIDCAGTTRRFMYDPAGELLNTRVFRSGARRGEAGSPAWRREGMHEDTHYVFDRAGNLVHTRAAHQEITLRWDAAGQLAETVTTRRAGQGDANDDHHLRVRYEYDAFRRRVRKITSSRQLESSHTTVRQFFWDGDVLASELRADQSDEKNGLTQSVQIRRDVRDWIHYPDTFRPLAVVHRTLDSRMPPRVPEHAGVVPGSAPSLDERRSPKAIADYSAPNATSTTRRLPASYRPVSTVYFFHNDPNGAPVRVVDERGRTAWEASYATWSSNTPIQQKDRPPFDQPIRLQGQYYDEETGFCYNRYRYLDHGIGQFISQDPSCIEGGSALYRYAPNPAAWIDPYGLANTIDGHGNTVPIVALGIPDKSLFKPKSGITTAYSRNSQCGPTTAQTRSVQGKPCVACNQTATTMVADHIDALVVEYYRTGTNDVTVQTSIAAVQPHCPDCSRSQGGKASGFSRAMKKALHLP